MKSMRTCVRWVNTRVRKMLWVLRCTRRANNTDTAAGRPMPMLSATRASNNARARRGASSTMVRENLNLTHAELPPVASLAIGACERTGDADNPIVEERLELGRTESITDSLQPAWVFAVRKAVSQLGEGEAFASRLTFGPIVPVDPHLQRVREIAANLDEAQPERWVEDIKVVHRHSAIGFVEAELWSVLLGASPIAHEHLLDLLGDDDGHHSGCGGLVDVFADVIELAVIPARPIRRIEVQHWDAIDLGEAPHGVAETITN